MFFKQTDQLLFYIHQNLLNEECIEFKLCVILQLHRICMIFTVLLTVAGIIIILVFLHWELKVPCDYLFWLLNAAVHRC